MEFNNSIIIQYGQITTNTSYIFTFPITFKKYYQITAACDSLTGNSAWNLRVLKTDLSKATFESYDRVQKYFICIGS